MTSTQIIRKYTLSVLGMLIVIIGKTQYKDSSMHVGYLDHTALREQFNAYRIAKGIHSSDYTAAKKNYDDKKNAIEKSYQDAKRVDSINGGKDRKAIEESSSIKRLELEKEAAETKTKLHQKSIEITQRFEQQIKEAVIQVINENYLLDVKPLTKDLDQKKIVNITTLVLDKLK